MDHKELEGEYVGWISVAQDGVYRGTLVNTTVEFRFHKTEIY
jgi:hypothetical protein